MLKTLMTGAAALTIMAGAALAERKLTFGLQSNEASNLYQGVAKFRETLEKLSGGEMTVDIFANASLGDFKAMVDQVQAGELDMVMTGYPDLSYLIPELTIVGAPYVVDDFAHLQRINAGPWGQEMNAKMEEQNIRLLDIWYQGTRQTTTNKAIGDLGDIVGLRLRTPNVPFLIAYAENIGAIPAPVAFQEVYLALQTNQVDGQENPLSTIEEMKFYEVQDHIAITNHFIASAAIQIGTSTWGALSDQEKAWVSEAVVAGGDLADQLTFADEARLLEVFEKRGMIVTRPDTGPFREAMKPYWDGLEAEFGKGAIARVRGAK